jgi:hypothetical protein
VLQELWRPLSSPTRLPLRLPVLLHLLLPPRMKRAKSLDRKDRQATLDRLVVSVKRATLDP